MKVLFNVALFILLTNAVIYSEYEIPDNIEDIKISLNTDAEINHALFVLKKDDPEIFKMLKELRQKNEEEFKIKLKNHYYSWLHTKVLEKKMKPRTKGYRIQIKESEIKFQNLKEKYMNAPNEQKEQVLNEMRIAAAERYIIEYEFMKFHVEQAKKFAEDLETKTNNFEKDKEKFITRIVTKLTVLDTNSKNK